MDSSLIDTIGKLLPLVHVVMIQVEKAFGPGKAVEKNESYIEKVTDGLRPFFKSELLLDPAFVILLTALATDIVDINNYIRDNQAESI